MNKIGIDTSLSSTAVYILLSDGSEVFFNYRNDDHMSKWHKTLSYFHYADYSIPKLENYSDQEIAKLIKWDELTTKIVNDILKYCKPEESDICTEGFSFSSNAGPLIDLVTYATLLRNKLIHYNFNSFLIKSPMTLKVDTCVKVYGPGEKKKPARNTLGIAGGKFTKTEMLEALFASNIVSRLKSSLSFHKEELLKLKKVPKPIDDIIDAFWLVHSNI